MDCFAYPHGIKALIQNTAVWPAVPTGILRAYLVLQGAVYTPGDDTLSDVDNGGAYHGLINGSNSVNIPLEPTLSVLGTNCILTFTPFTTGNVDANQMIEAVVVYVSLGLGPSDPPLVWMTGGTYPTELPKLSSGGTMTVTPPSEGILRFRA